MKEFLLNVFPLFLGGVAALLVTSAVDLNSKLMAMAGLFIGMLSIAVGVWI